MVKRHFDDIGLIIIILAIALTVVFLLTPILMSMIMSFDSRDYLGKFPPPSLSFKWYEKFFSDDYYLRGLRTSLILAVIAASVSTIIGVASAFVLNSYQFRGKDALSAFFMSPLLIPAVVVGFALLLFFSIIGIFDGFVRLIGGHIIITAPYTIRATLAGLIGIRKCLTEAALSLGANEREAFWGITFPLARTGIVAGTVFAFAFSMDDVAVSLFLTDPTAYTLPVAMVSMMRADFDLTIAAAAVILVVFTIVLIYTLDRFIGLDKIIGEGIYRA